MKNIKYLFGALVFVAFSCNKTEPIPPPAPDAGDLMVFTAENIGEATQHFTADANSTIFIYGEKGTNLYLPANSLVDEEGNLVTGDVDIELIEINKKSEMVLMNKATNGKRAGGTLGPLVSSGEFYISMSQSGAEVTLTTPLLVTAPTPNYTPQTKKFLNVANEGEDLLWETANDSLIVFEEDSASLAMHFEILPDEWGWTNCDYFYEDPRTKTNVSVLLPEGFNAENTNIFISIDGEMVVVNYFTALELPIGLDCHFIAIGIVGDELNYSIHDVTIVADHVEDIDDFAATTEDALTTLIEALP